MRSGCCERRPGEDVQIHVAGGVANRLGREELEGFVAAVADDGGDHRREPVRLDDDTPRQRGAKLARLSR